MVSELIQLTFSPESVQMAIQQVKILAENRYSESEPVVNMPEAEEFELQVDDIDLAKDLAEDLAELPVPADLDPALLEEVSVQTTNLGGRQRQLQAQINLIHSVERVWQLLTAYDDLAEFIPNLAKSQRLQHPNGGIRIEQVGVQNALFLKFSARVVLDMEEEFPQRIRFQMVEGDFKDFSGTWELAPWNHPAGMGTALTYTLLVWPKRTMPVIAIERRLRRDLSYNLLAIRQRLNEITQGE